MHLYRFPLKDQVLLEKWENAVMRINNNSQLWKATRFSFICSNHFDQQDYVIPPSSDKTCRLKKYAVPSVFSSSEQPTAMGLSDAQKNRLGISRKHHLPRDESDAMSPAAKIFLNHNYARKQQENTSSQDDLTVEVEEQDKPDLEQKLKQKIKNLQQKLRRSKKKLQSMADLVSHLQQKLVISSEQAGILNAAFGSLQLSLFKATKNNATNNPSARGYDDQVKEFALTLYFYSPKTYKC